MPHARQTFAARPSRMPAGFTLVELMISIALVLVLILGVNQVFKIATDSVGAGQALSDQSRENRAVQTVLFNDLSQSVIRSIDMPAFIIRSTRTSAFLDREDELSDRSYATLYATQPDPTPATVEAEIRSIDLDSNNTEGEGTVFGEVIPRNKLGQRNFRQDVMTFFARHLYPRQTANDGAYVSQMTASEAWVWYGHLRQPADALNSRSVNKNPGIDPTGTTPRTENFTSNPNNFYARQWAVGRVAMLLRQPNAVASPGVPLNVIQDKTGQNQRYIGRDPGTAANRNYGPLGQNSRSTTNITDMDPAPPSTAGMLIEHSRYDLAGTTIDEYRRILRENVLPAVGTLPANVPRWYGAGGLSFRFAGYAFPTSPLNSYGVARTTPWLVGGATNLIFEFAGDYLEQNDAGLITDNYRDDVDGDGEPGTDGRVDFTVDADGVRRTRWYGFPRDVSGDGAAGAGGTPIGRPDDRITGPYDVYPLRDSLAGGAAACEHFVNSTLPANNYLNPALNAEYIVAWQPAGTYLSPTGVTLPDVPLPKLIRVTLTIDDPSGRLPEGQTYENVIELPG